MMKDQVKLHFLGAARTVTGSKYLLETPELNILIDCGMFQGLKELRLLNWEEFPFPADKIDYVLLTHGHLDHSGYLPRLIKQGFKGTIIGTPPSLAIADIIIQDSAKIMEEDAERANAEGFSSHHPALPFYTIEEAARTLNYFKSANLNDKTTLSDSIQYTYKKNGHIIGATFIELEVFGKVMIFSGDIGRDNDLLLEKPDKPKWADYVLLESTYGDRLHPQDNGDEILISSIKEAITNNGTLIIPSFAVERLQTLMYKLWLLYKQNKIPNIPIFIDSPMGNRVLEVFRNFPDWHQLPMQDFYGMQEHFNIITKYSDTWKTVDNPRAKVIIAGSGMVTGGRVLTYLRYYIDKPETTVLLVGYQAEGTRGRQLKEGTHEIKIFGKYCPVKATIKSIDSLSAHADQEGLINWLSEIKNVPEMVFLVHGEPTASDKLRLKIKDTYNYNVHIPKLQEYFSFNI